jgi:aryl-alcohol dehydrogenase-like predicted oxidoreductase
VTTTGACQGETIARALEVGIFDTVQATWNLLERSAGPMLTEAHSAGLGVIVKEALANGRLTPRGDVAPLRELAERRDVAPDALALAAALAQPWADVVLSGVATVETLRSNLAALELDLDEQLDRELDGLAEEPARYWEERAALPWN